MFNHNRAIAKDQSMPPVLQWRVFSEEKIVRRKEIQKEDEDILVQFVTSFSVGELAKYSSAWVIRHLNVNKIYIISTTVDVDFTTAVDLILAFVDAEGELIDIKLLAERDSSLLSLFSRNGAHEILEYTDEMRRLVMQSRVAEIKMLILTGFMNMNPVLVTVQLQRCSEDQTSMEIKGLSKEGLIRQHAGKKIVLFMAQRIEEQLEV